MLTHGPKMNCELLNYLFNAGSNQTINPHANTHPGNTTNNDAFAVEVASDFATTRVVDVYAFVAMCVAATSELLLLLLLLLLRLQLQLQMRL